MSNESDYKPCRRCGCRTAWNRKAKLPGVCRDCRASDPQFVRALMTGTPLIGANL